MEIRAHRQEMAIMWLHLDGEAITEARHCVICQPHGHVIDAACADCGDGPLITGHPPSSSTSKNIAHRCAVGRNVERCGVAKSGGFH
jgi:hypothetical protein